ncbi:bifunctional salicylyl-CoA 5-hydroxylase/oxidoreductase [Aurantiacibacter rhizosphaerae]|uniref:Bifunctional salicylyl-CoA 5-hydroxylase/oxidoreductase n=1 Tax=Aurantiacibacter rhizosphaerae TaxID=2691582 RepID=A0A844XAX7_9SPHN|nr:bifunctional salicylyl-CoA 5-hydroxylase/oxidoreductase [Aurantiacibacter rhizosphaerae]MWV27116.1 bifunctional salicylyl-CoA 5-hydroxylase/oxidoreductase [Aurantiacibacter rhizosphaerae]
MRIACLGGGPAGLYFAISMKLRAPSHDIHVFERNKAGDTFGWGVVFSDQTLENLTRNDAVSAKTIIDRFAHWDDIEVTVGDRSMTSGGHGFIGIGRKQLLVILQERARELGIHLHFEYQFDGDLEPWSDYDLVVAADGVNSQIRNRYEDRFDTDIQVRANKFMWLGTTRMFDAFAFIFEKTEHGWIWAHAYRFDDTHSTFIVECSQETWDAFGFELMSQQESIAVCEKVFARHLDGHALLTNASHLRGSAAWINFTRVLCNTWSFDNVVLLGDAAHTAHFSIGSGTKLALEDAMKLAEVLDRPGLDNRATMAAALEEYQEVRQLEVLKIQNSARNSTEWFETLDRYLGFDLPQFTYSLMTRSQRISHDNLRQRDGAWLAEVERWFAEEEAGERPTEPMFLPYKLGKLQLDNRIVVAPMLTYNCDPQGRTTDFHTAHYIARGLGGAGLVMSEMVAVSPEGRPTPACPGLWDDDQIEGWARINRTIHEQGGAKTCVQLGHAGPRAACKVPDWNNPQYDVPMHDPWDILSASATPWSRAGIVPRAMSQAEIDTVVTAFADATRRADHAGFDMVEIQAGHGFLLSSFITPVLNQRDDDYGGSLENRMRLTLRIIAAVREALPASKPIAVRISATDWMGEAGVQPQDAVEIATMLKAAGVDIVDVSSGEISPDATPVYGRMYQTPFADRIRNEVQIPTIAVGNITERDQANSILIAGRADLVAIGRPHLSDASWTARAAAEAQSKAFRVPFAYAPGQAQMRQLARRRQEMEESMRA